MRGTIERRTSGAKALITRFLHGEDDALRSKHFPHPQPTSRSRRKTPKIFLLSASGNAPNLDLKHMTIIDTARPLAPASDGFLTDAGVNDLASPFDVTRHTDIDRYYRIHVIPPNATVHGSLLYMRIYMRRTHDRRQSAIAGTQQGLMAHKAQLPHKRRLRRILPPKGRIWRLRRTLPPKVSTFSLLMRLAPPRTVTDRHDPQLFSSTT